MYLVLVGGGNVGIQLAKRMLAKGHELILMERDPKRAQRIATVIGEDSVFLGDGCEIATQKAVGFARADVVVAVTGDDEDNLVVCQMAKQLWDVKRILARVNDPSHETIFRHIGVDLTVSATGIIEQLLEQQIADDELIPIGALSRGQIEVVEVRLSQRSPATGKQVRELTLPPQTNIVWIIRDGQGMIVDGSTVLQDEDMLVAVVPSERAEELRLLLKA